MSSSRPINMYKTLSPIGIPQGIIRACHGSPGICLLWFWVNKITFKPHFNYPILFNIKILAMAGTVDLQKKNRTSTSARVHLRM